MIDNISTNSFKRALNGNTQEAVKRIAATGRRVCALCRCLLLIIFAVLMVPALAQAAWYDANWSNRQIITILPTLADADLTNFPYLVKITDPANPVFSIAQADGDDILFTSADGTTKLNHEIEKYTPATNELYIWVQVPTISSTANTDIYMYYGNGSVASQQSVAATWDNDFVMVQHLHETSGTHFDSTSQNNDGSPQNGVVQTATGQIDGADAFDMLDDYVAVPDSTSLRVVAMTLEAWVRIPTPLPSSGFHGIINHGNSSNANWYQLSYDGPNNQFHYRWSIGSVRRTNFTATASADTWYYVVGVLNAGTSTAYTYLNGGLDTTITGASLPTATASPLDIGRSLSTEMFKGIIDEVRISKVARTPEWIAASFRNQNTPDTYASLEPEETYSWTIPLYLKGDGVPSGSLSTAAPTAGTLPNYDPGRDTSPGLSISKGTNGVSETDPTKYQEWVTSTEGGSLSGSVSLIFWSALKDFQTEKRGIVDAFLLDCDSGGANCSSVAQGQLDLADWSGGSGTWVEHTINFGTLSHTVLPGRTLKLKITVGNSADDDMWFAYDTTSYPSRLDLDPTSNADLEVSKTVDNSAPSEEDTVNYTVTLTNNGPAAAANITLTDLLPAGVTYVSDTRTQGTYSSGSGLWTVGTLSNGNAATLTITATVNAGTGGSTISNTANNLSADKTDPDSTNNQDSADITVTAPPLGACPGWVVTTTADSGAPGTLRECIIEANKFSGVTLSVPAGTYTLTIAGQGEDAAATGDLDITANMTISGAGADSTIIQAGTDATNGIDRVFHLLADATLSDMTVRFGNLGTSTEGGGIYIDNAAVVNLTEVAVQNNTGKHGGGIYNRNGTLTVSASTISGNAAASGHGGGLYHDGGTTATLTNVTFSGNSATSDGGGIYGNDPLTLVNVTLTGNTASKGGGIRRNGGTASLKNTIIAGNTAATGPNCDGTITSAGYNLDSGNSCLLTGTGDQINTDPLLGNLLDNGGPTLTHALALLSPAVDAGTNSGAPATDQRGQPRPYDGDGDAVAITDIGAYESQQTSDNVSGNVYEDVNGDADLFDKVAAAGVRVRLYADTNDDGVVDAGDTFIREKLTDASGHYSLPLDTATTGLKYLVAVDSKGVVPAGGLNVGFVQGDVWAEQTYGDNPSTAALDLGARIGGRTAGTSDGFNTASTAPANNTYQHLARLDLSGGNVAGIDFAFSFRVISHPADRDDDAAANRTAQGTLRQTIQNANAIVGAPTLSVPANTYTLAIAGTGEDGARTGDLDVTDAVTLTGAGAPTTIINGNAIDRVFHVFANTTTTGVTVQGGNLGTSTEGGGIYIDNAAVVNLTEVAIQNNTGKHGGGIYNKNGTLTVTESTISGNAAANGNGGGLFHDAGTTVILTNVTFSGNSSTSDGGGIHAKDPVTLTNVTLANNSSGNKGGGIRREGGTASLKNTIVANNTATGGDPNCTGTITSAGYNLDSGNSCLFTGTGDQTNTNPNLGPLQDNGGPTLTHALLAGSPAIDAATTTGAPAVDQRGVARGADGDGTPNSPVSGDYDIGAYEAAPLGATIKGTVFEDADFAGTAADYDGGTSDLALANVEVELYDATDTHVISATTDASGGYSFTGLADGTYKVRVRSATIGDADTPPKAGLNATVPATWPYPLAELAWANGAALYGGQNSILDDTVTADNAGPGDTYVSVTVSGSDVGAVNFGFAYNLIVNTGDDSNVDSVQSQQGSLRQFIKNANAIGLAAASTAKLSQFRIPTSDPNYNGSGDGEFTIQPVAALPTIYDRMALDGTTQTTNIGDTNTSGPEIELDGQLVDAGLDGLYVIAGGSTIKGLVINRFSSDGIYLASNGGNTIEGNYIGTDVTGTTDLGNTGSGVYVYESTGNTIGGSSPGTGNLISGNDYNAIEWTTGRGVMLYRADGNSVIGNYIGTDRTGTVAIGNEREGVGVSNCINNTVGGSGAGEENLISGNSGVGVWIGGGGTTGNRVLGNLIGTQVDGTSPLGNGSHGVAISNTATNNIIGGSATGEGNVIAYSTGDGVWIDGSTTDFNLISGNAIFENGGLGIDLESDGVGATGGANNNKAAPVITGIAPSGSDIAIIATAGSGDTVEFFRVDNAAAPAVTADPSGSGEGYLYLGSCVDDGACSGPHVSAVADADPAAGSVQAVLLSTGVGFGDTVTATATDTSSNTSEFATNFFLSPCPGGVVITTADSGFASLRECINYANGNPGTTISFDIPGPGNQSSGADSWWRITLSTVLPAITADGTTINATTQTVNRGDTNTQGPEVEINGNGISDHGLTITSANNTLRGFLITRFSSSSYHAVNISGSGATGNVIAGNYIGTNFAGTAADATTRNGYGIRIVDGAQNNTIGGVDAADRNLLSGNTYRGINITGTGTDANQVLGNYIGTTVDGSAALPNGWGIYIISGASNNTIGGANPGEGNLISGNTNTGIRIEDGAGNIIKGNRIGTDAAGTTALGNTDGIGIHSGATANIIGGSASGESNLISGNSGHGVWISGSGTDGHIIQGNLIGTDAAGTGDLGNGNHGVYISGGPNSNVIGGSVSGEGNVIAFNGGDGVFLTTSTTDYNLISGNSIFENAGLGIDLDPDGVGATGGANNNKTPPVITQTALSGSDFIVVATAEAGDTVEFFRAVNAAAPAVSPDATGYGEGYLYLGRCVDDGVCDGPYMGAAADGDPASGTVRTTLIGTQLAVGDDLTATATSTTSNTSEFAANVRVGTYNLTGRVFEDADFSGMATDYDGGTNDLSLANVDVELYDASDTYITSTVTDAGGNYVFPGISDGTYKVRARSETIGDADTPPKGGLNASVPATWPYPLAELAWANGGALYGGQNPILDDTATADNAGPGDTYVAVTVSGSDVGSINFGFAYNLIVNTLDNATADNVRSRQGSLRQFIKNANAIGSAGGTTANISQFRIPVGSLSGGVALFSPVAELPSLADSTGGTTIDGSSQTANIGNTNTAGPEVELAGTNAGAANIDGFHITGGNCTIRGLVINRFSSDAIQIDSGGSNVIAGNYIGTDASGTTDLGNAVGGVRVASSGNTIGGTTAAARNIIAGNNSLGVILTGASATGNVVAGNYIGTDRTGSADLGNGAWGVFLSGGAANNTVGGIVAGAGNVISGHSYGVHIRNAGTTGNFVQGNLIGTDANGTAALYNTSGVQIDAGATGNTIGGSAAAARNVISGNQSGVVIQDSGTSGNQVIGNTIGLDITGSVDLGNNLYGVLIEDGASGNTIGGSAVGEGNLIAYNGSDGIAILSPLSEGDYNRISGNSIFENAELGIDLDPNGVGASGGANEDKAAPVITGLTPSGSDFTIIATAGSGDTVEFFRVNNAAAPAVTADPSGSGEGYLYLGSCVDNGACSGPHISPAADADAAAGSVQAVLLSSGLSIGDTVTATATDTSSNTSEFAANVLIEVFTISGTIYHDANANNSLDFDEIGLGDIVWAKLVQGGTVLQVVQPNSETGAYTFTNIPNGTYALIADDNALTTDATPTPPANWQFQNPLGGSVTVTVAGGDVTGRNLGLVYDLLAPCECGYGNGMPLQTAISIDGNMTDWASVLSDLDNSACDAADSTDLDYKVQSTGRNLVRISFTYNATNFYMFTQRTGQNNNTQTFVYYCDADNDGLVEAGEPAIAALWQGNNGTVDMKMYAYQPDDPAGDPLVDADGYADGYSMPGTLSYLRDLSDGGGDATGTQMEWAVSWADLGVTPGSAMAWHTSSTNVTPDASSLPNQIDDNLGGCGGQCAGSNQFGGVAPSPVAAALDAVTYLYHQIENTGNANDAFDLASSDTGDFAIVSYTYYEDVGVLGLYEDGIDLLLTDTTGSGTVDTGTMTPGQIKRIIVAALLPSSPIGTHLHHDNGDIELRTGLRLPRHTGHGVDHRHAVHTGFRRSGEQDGRRDQRRARHQSDLHHHGDKRWSGEHHRCRGGGHLRPVDI